MLLEFENLTFKYPKTHAGLDNFNLKIDAPGKIGCLGTNGAGKSTFVKILLGMLHPGRGKALCMGFESKFRRPEMLRETAFVPEEFELPEMDSTAFCKLYSVFYPRFDFRKFTECQSIFQLKDPLHLKRLSFGQKKKFLLSFALATNSKILILDEPGNGLDIPSKLAMRNLLHEENNEERLVILSTHQLSEVKDVLTSIMIIENGGLLCCEKLQTVNEKFQTRKSAEKNLEGSLFAYRQGEDYVHLLPKDTGSEPETVDLEAFFVAVIQNPNLLAK